LLYFRDDGLDWILLLFLRFRTFRVLFGFFILFHFANVDYLCYSSLIIKHLMKSFFHFLQTNLKFLFIFKETSQKSNFILFCVKIILMICDLSSQSISFIFQTLVRLFININLILYQTSQFVQIKFFYDWLCHLV